MDNNELNLEELMGINGGVNDAVPLISKNAMRHNCFLANGNIDLNAVKESMNKEDLEELTRIRNQLLAQQDLMPNANLGSVYARHSLADLYP